MSRRSHILSPPERDGTSQRWREMSALDPGSLAVDERGPADLLAFVQAFSAQLRFFTATDAAPAPRDTTTWAAFASHPDLSLADIQAHLADPDRFTGERARWLARPHFALLLTFLELLGKARDHQSGLVRRHLEHYYREVLRMRPEAAVPDRVAAVFRLAARADDALLPAGTAVEAGRDSASVPRIYRSERDLWVGRARVAELRSVFLQRRRLGLADIRKQPGIAPAEVREQMLRLALGHPNPGDPVPPWAGAPVDLTAVKNLGPLLTFADTTRQLFLEHHELRAMMLLVRRRAAADAEWAELNRLLGVRNPPNPRDFAANLKAVVGPLDFTSDGLSQVHSVDDLYRFHGEPAVRSYIETRLAPIGLANFVKLMAIKSGIDADWANINRHLERIGRRTRKLLTWRLDASDPAAFTANLTRAYDKAWPPPWPPGVASIDAYDAKIRQLEAHFAMSAEALLRLVDFASKPPPRDDPSWNELAELLTAAHREKFHAAGRARLASARGPDNSLAGFDATVAAALGGPQPWDPGARTVLLRHLDRGQLAILDTFRRQFAEPALRPFTWADVDRVLELAARYVDGQPEPVPQRSEWQNLHALADATSARSDDDARWKLFGRRPPASASAPPTATLGWALRSPLLALAQGTRTLTLTLGLRTLDRAALLRGLGLGPAPDPVKLRDALAAALVIDITTRNGPAELTLTRVRIASGAVDDDYFICLGVARPPGEDRPALQLELLADPQFGPISGPGSEPPTLRLTLRQRWDPDAREWFTTLTPFEPLVLAAVHLRVDVAGLTDLRLQHEDRELDPKKPSEPFGPRPAVGARLHVWHPELAGRRLSALRLDLGWMGLPKRLQTHYAAYPDIAGAASFTARVLLFDRDRELPLTDTALFHDDPDRTARDHAISIPADGLAVLAAYDPRDTPNPARDLRTADRHLVVELTRDFGHALYPSLVAARARDLAIGLARGTVTPDRAGDYAVEPPYTPTLQRIAAAYRSELTLDPNNPSPGHRLLHVHPFGEAPLAPGEPRLFPRQGSAGELYIGLADTDLPQPLALLLQLAEGTSDPDRPPAKIEWSALDADTWRPLGEGLRHDSTRGLINSGIVELDLPALAPGTLLPPGLTWLRASLTGDPASVCDAVGIHTQAVMLRFADQGNAADHHAQPLAVGSVERLVDPDPRIAEVLQPYTSSGGRPAERPEQFYTRVSERLRHKQRALTAWDHERLVLHAFPQIYKAKCLARGDQEPGSVDVIVIPDIREALPADALAPRAPANLLADIQAYLTARAPASARIRVRNAHYVAVKLAIAVSFRPGQDVRRACARLQDDLRRHLSPWAYDEGEELMIGGKIYASSVVDFIDRRDYVDYVADLKLARSDDGQIFTPIPPTLEDYHVATVRPDQVLVSARLHTINPVSELDYQQSLSTGINYMGIEADFLVS